MKHLNWHCIYPVFHEFKQGAGPEQRWQDLIYRVPGEGWIMLNVEWYNSFEIILIVISYQQAFEGSLCVPDALYKTAFQLFDTNGNGTVSFVHSLLSLF